jgi:hypothetical protein
VDRVLRGSVATISATWYDANGAVADPGTVTVQVDRDDGTNLVAAGGATSGSGANARTFALTSTHTALLDQLKATWTSSTLGTLTTYVEVAGGFLFSIAEARKLAPLQDATKYPTADILVARTLAETALEDDCRCAFVPRYRRELVDEPNGSLLPLQRVRPTAVRSIKREGVAMSTPDLADIRLRRDGSLYRRLGWQQGIISWANSYEVAYEHGHPYPPPRVGRAALLLARRWLVESPIDERTTAVSTEGGTISFLAAGIRGSFDMPEVNEVVRRYGMTTGIA